jgi:hypothetical protein
MRFPDFDTTDFVRHEQGYGRFATVVKGTCHQPGAPCGLFRSNVRFADDVARRERVRELDGSTRICIRNGRHDAQGWSAGAYRLLGC